MMPHLANILSFVIGVAMIVVAFAADGSLTWFILACAGCLMIAMSIVATEFQRRAYRVIVETEPIPGRITVTRDDEGSMARVRVHGTDWTMGIRSRRSLEVGAEYDAEVWIDPANGRPLAVAVHGQQLGVVPFPHKTNRT
jgi:membrane protein implicated in regulation of membrane protease activity